MVYLDMPAMGKEQERPLTPDEIALREIQGYIDKVERQAETKQPQVAQTQPQPVVTPQLPQKEDKGMAQFVPVIQKPKIVLPINQTEMEYGLKQNVLNGVRWLSEWCVMMIKKYPGRVFYSRPEANK